ncbi:MAG: DUF6067 family protein, partial [Candidatus Omnitrophica bacterium]|nr:DUF6067 family protein [Candidatus Omnitrophota bacterium]
HHCGEGSTLTRDILIPKFYGYPFGIPVSFTRWNNPVYPETRMNSWRFVLQCDSTIKAHPSMIISGALLPGYKGGCRENYIRKGYDINGEAVYKIWQTYKKYNWNDSKWIPAWKVKDYIETYDQDIWACIHKNPKEAIITISSFKEEDFNGKIKIYWEKLGFDYSKIKIIDCITDEEIKPEKDGIILNVKSNLFRMLFLTFKN